MIFIILHVVVGKILEQNIHIGEPVLIGKFSGNEITYEFSCSIVKGYEESSLLNYKLQLLIWDSRLSYVCNDASSALMQSTIRVPAYGIWSHDHDGSISINNTAYFYLADCERELSNDSVVSVKLIIQDAINRHISSEVVGLRTANLVSLLLFLMFSAICIFKLYQEKNEEAPMVILFVLSITLVLAIIFSSLHIWIYEMNGVSYKFMTIFAELFKSSFTASIIGLLLLVLTENFNQKNFFLEERQFLILVSMIFFEFCIASIYTYRNNPMEHFENFTHLDALVLLLIRIIYALILYRSSLNISCNYRLRILKICALMFILFPIQAKIMKFILPHHAQDTIIISFYYSLALFLLILLFSKFTDSNSFTLLPVKSHKV